MNGSAATESLRAFESFWYDDTQPMKVFFWGDLDWSGLGILASLRKIFSSATAWEPGYSIMLDFVANGVCHSRELAGKEKQNDPGMTGCEYADEVLRPIILRGFWWLPLDSFLKNLIVAFLSRLLVTSTSNSLPS